MRFTKKFAATLTAMFAIILLASAAFAADPSWDELKAFYKYDKSKPLNIQIADTKDIVGGTKIHFYYESINGGKVPAFLYMPKPTIKPMRSERSTVDGAYPVLFFMHFHVSDKSLAELFSTLPGQGVAVMAIDGVFRGEREEKGMDILMPDPFLSAKHMKMQILDILRGIDVLSQWKGIDPNRIGYMGISMGACTGTAAVALDDRIKAAIIADGAADFSVIFQTSDYGSVMEIKKYMDENKITQEQLWEKFVYVDPVSFAPHIHKPVLFENGVDDTTMTLPAMKKLHEITSSKDKKVIWYKSGHILPFDRVVYDSIKWLKSTL